MSPAQDPGQDGPDQQEPLAELLGAVFDLADEVTSAISPEEVAARLRRTLQESADEAPAPVPAAGSARPGARVAGDIGSGGIEREQSRPTKIRREPSPPGPGRHLPLVAAIAGHVAAQAAPEESDWGVPPSIFDTRASGPTVQRLVLGNQLRQLRESRGITTGQAAEAIRSSFSKIRRMEYGRVSVKEREIADLLTLYGVTDNEERATLLSLAETTRRPGWWHAYSDILPSWLEPYIGLEAGASVIRSCQNQLVPVLLRTEGYARALIQAVAPRSTEDEIERRLALQIGRQEILRGPDAPQLWVVIDEAVLRRRVGPREVMREQLKHLIEVSHQPMVTLQILPYSEGVRLAMSGSFTILRFAEPGLPDVVYIEELTSALYVESLDQVDQYTETMNHLHVEAGIVPDIRKLLGQILADI